MAYCRTKVISFLDRPITVPHRTSPLTKCLQRTKGRKKNWERRTGRCSRTIKSRTRKSLKRYRIYMYVGLRSGNLELLLILILFLTQEAMECRAQPPSASSSRPSPLPGQDEWCRVNCRKAMAMAGGGDGDGNGGEVGKKRRRNWRSCPKSLCWCPGEP